MFHSRLSVIVCILPNIAFEILGFVLLNYAPAFFNCQVVIKMLPAASRVIAHLLDEKAGCNNTAVCLTDLITLGRIERGWWLASSLVCLSTAGAVDY